MKYLRNKVILSLIITDFILLLLGWGFLIWQIKPQAEPLLLHYNIYFGIDAIGSWYQIFYLPGSATVFFLLNLVLSSIISRKDMVLSYLPLIASLLAELIISVAAVLIILLNRY